MIEIITGIELIIVGFFIGILAAMVGIGGGLVNVPVLIFIFGLSTPQSSAISTLVIVATSTTGGITYWRHKRIDLRTGAYFASISVPAAFVGGLLADRLDADFLTVIFGILMLLIAIRKIISMYQERNNQNGQIIKNNSLNNDFSTESIKPIYGTIPQSVEERLIVDNEGTKFHYQVQLKRTLLGAFLGGLIGGLLGVGGGVIFVPVLTSIGGLPPHVAVATSTFTIIFTSTSASLARVLGKNVLFEYVFFLAIGTVSGARLGALKVRRISSEKILALFYIVVFVAGIRTILKGLGIF
ncbi:MAG: sulfite exporter TauE/SafE family protein [Candidatus Hodarchaeales archaeon]|jgi:uncharacterized membrane protein YfcA